ncbi:GNAT family N-acetyltransferase, partial [Bifidobacterium longum]
AQAASAGHDYAAEVVLFVLDPAARGHGLGRRMFETLMDAFRLAGVRDYFLFTDTTCDVGFYVHRGLTQVCEQSLPASVPGENPSSFYLYEGSVPEPA